MSCKLRRTQPPRRKNNGKKDLSEEELLKKEMKSKLAMVKRKAKSLKALRTKVDQELRKFQPEFADKTVTSIDDDLKSIAQVETKYLARQIQGVEEFDELIKGINDKLQAFSFKG